MATDDRDDQRLEMKSCNIILTGKPQKYQHYRPDKLVNMDIIQVKKYCRLMKYK